jgi:hypothetical protein
MKAGICYRLLVLLLILAGVCGIQGCLADSANSDPASLQISPLETVQKATSSPTVKVTIAPIHTKEPVIKPPVDQPSPIPSIIPSTPPADTRPIPTTGTPTSTPEVAATVTPGDNESASTYFQWGRAYEDAGDYNASIREFDRAIAREPYYTDAWYHKALSYEKLGMWDDAYQSYRFLLTIDPGYPASANITGSNSSGLSDRRPPLPAPQNTGTPLVWIALGVGITGVVVGSILFYVRRRSGNILPTDQPPSASSRQSIGNQAPFPDIDAIGAAILPYYSGDIEVCKAVIRLAIEIAREGREGKAIGTAFVLGDSDAVLERSRQLILNPLAGHSEDERYITSSDMRENIKELALVDGAFVIRETGIVEAAGRYISIDTSNVNLPKGFGTRHVSVAAITQETRAIGIVVSESGGMVRVFADGRVIAETM